MADRSDPTDARTKSWRDRISVHEAADLFPPMSDAELDELADDIARNGLHHKPVFWGGFVGPDDEDLCPELIDGRNRLEAMERAGIELPLLYESIGEVL